MTRTKDEQGSGRASAPTPPTDRELQARLYAAALLVAAVIALRPLGFFLNASREFSLQLPDVADYSLTLFLSFAGALLFLCLPFAARRLARERELFTAVLIALALMLWLQGYYFLWDYGALDGRPLDFAGFTVHGIAEVLCWIAVFVLCLRLRGAVVARSGSIALIVLASLAFGLYTSHQRLPVQPWHKRYHANTDSYFTFSQERNVIVLVIDSSRGDVFQEMLAGLTPAEKAVFDGFTFFRNTTGSFNSTDPGVSGFLTGRVYDYATWRDNAYQRMYTSDSSVPYRLKQAGYRNEVYPYNRSAVHLEPGFIDNLTPNKQLSPDAREELQARELDKLQLVASFNFSPHFLKRAMYDSDAMYGATAPSVAPPRVPDAPPAADAPLPPGIVQHLNYNRWILEQFQPRMKLVPQPVFKYLHYHGGHPPFFHDERYRGVRLPFTLASYRKQYQGALLLTVGALVDALKKHGVYDRTMLVVLGDHGVYVPRTEATVPSASDLDVVPDTLRPLLMVKPFGEAKQPLATSSAPVSLFDVAPTILAALGMQSTAPGRNVFQVREGERRPRFAYSLALSPDDPGAERGALVYRIDGDAADRAAWQLQRRSMLLHEGEVELPDDDFEETRRELTHYLNDTSRFVIP